MPRWTRYLELAAKKTPKLDRYRKIAEAVKQRSPSFQIAASKHRPSLAELEMLCLKTRMRYQPQKAKHDFDKNSISAFEGQRNFHGNLQINLQRGRDLQTTLLVIQQSLSEQGAQINDIDARDKRLNAPVVVQTSLPFATYQECDRSAVYPTWTAAETARRKAEKAKQDRIDRQRAELEAQQAKELTRQLLSHRPRVLS